MLSFLASPNTASVTTVAEVESKQSNHSRSRVRRRNPNNHRHDHTWSIAADPFPKPKLGFGDQQIYTIVEGVQVAGWLTPSNSVEVPASRTFQLSDFSDASSLAAVFDSFRIMDVECWIVPRFTADQLGAQSTGLLVSVVDLNDISNLVSVQTALASTNAMVGSTVDGHYRRFVPMAAEEVYKSGVSTGYAEKPASTWMNTADAAVPFFALKAISTTVVTAAVSYDLIFRMKVQFRRVR